MRTEPKLLDVVELRRDIPEHGLRRGRVGAIVELLPPDCYEVEFVAPDGHTDAMLALSADAFTVVRREVAAARR